MLDSSIHPSVRPTVGFSPFLAGSDECMEWNGCLCAVFCKRIVHVYYSDSFFSHFPIKMQNNAVGGHVLIICLSLCLIREQHTLNLIKDEIWYFQIISFVLISSLMWDSNKLLLLLS